MGSVTRTTIWGACLAWLVYAALCCQGGPVSRFLAWSFWTPFARLTYAWYLMHPLWMDIIFQSAPAGLVYYDLLGASFYITNVIIGLMCAVCVFFLVEAP